MVNGKTSILVAIAILGLVLTAGCSDPEKKQSTGGGTTGGTTSQLLGGMTREEWSGPTLAPDLVSVGEFRDGPETDQGKPTTLVDFKFDQEAFLTGGNRTSFHLAPTNGGDPLDGADIVPEGDKEGDKVVTAAFVGRLSTKNFARGFVDKEVLSPDAQGNGVTNVGQSEDIEKETATSSPDLKTVTKDADQVLFKFDQPLTKDDVVQNTGGLRIYFPDTRQASAVAVRRTGDRNVLRATYKDLPGNFGLKDAAGGFVAQGAVQGKSKDATNTFDEVSPLKDTGAVVCPAPKIAGKTGEGKGSTEAPDLMAVGNFRRGPVTDQGKPRTCIDFTFDQKVFLKGGNRTSFHLATADGSDALDASGVVPKQDKEGDVVVSAAFPGKLKPKDFPRGYVDSKLVTSRKRGADSDNPFNINQVATVSGGGKTKNPELASVKRDGDQLFFKFDEPLTKDDVVQNNGGLRVYFPKTDNSSLRQAGALAVKRKDKKTLRAFFGNDLPGNFSLKDAAGVFVKQGAVQAAKDGRGGNNGKSAFDEVTKIGDTGTVVCPAPDYAGKSGKGKGPTAAPDLVSVGNFRRGPFTKQFTPTTCVDFRFDRKVFLKGGNRTSFHLATADGSDALDATGITPDRDKEGDVMISAAFPGKLKPKDFPRGYVDSKLVASRKQGANKDNPFNVSQAAVVSGKGKTKNPDLASVTKDGDQLFFKFDEPLTEDDVIQNTGGLRVYFPKTKDNTIKQAGAQAVKRKNKTTLRAYFGRDLPGNFSLKDAAGAFVKQGAVQAAKDGRGGNDGKSAFDEVSTIKDNGTVVCPAPEAAGKTGEGNGPTEAPDLVSVDNFRRGPFTSQFTPTTCVDFRFDQKAFLSGSNRTSFHLVPRDGSDALDAAGVVPKKDKDGDAIITAAFPGNLKPKGFARGYVDKEVLSSSKKGNALTNVPQAGDIGKNNGTKHPDLVSVTKDADQFLFKFDQPLTKDDVVQDTGGLRLYFPNSGRTQATAVDTTDNRKVLRATFKQLPEGLSLADATGAFVTQGTVQGTGEGATNAFDELSSLKDTGAEVCPASKNTGKSGGGKGPTEAPDLMKLDNFRRGLVTAHGNPRTCVDFTFDQKAFLTGGNRSSFHLAPKKGGDALDATNIIPDKDVSGDTIVTAMFPGDLKPKDFARGYVDKNILSSSGNGDGPTNVPQAGDIGKDNDTKHPDLVSITRDGDKFLFEFDQPLTQEDVVQDTGGLRLYFSKAQQSQATGVDKTDDPKVLRATFKQLPEDTGSSDAIGGFVTQGAVQGKGKNASNNFDEVSKIKKP